MTATVGVADTSVFIALESGRALEVDKLPDALVTTVITQAELELGVLAAPSTGTRSGRLATLQQLADLQVLDVTPAAAHEWARLRLELRDRGARMDANDLWIASIAAANGLPIVTQDTDFDALEGASGVAVIKV